MGIDKFLTNKPKSRVERFEKLAEGKDKKELRKLEAYLLQPESSVPHTGPNPTASGIRDHSVRLYFTPKDFRLFSKWFKVSTMVENSVKNIDLLLILLRQLEGGSLVYKDGKIQAPVISKRRNRV